MALASPLPGLEMEMLVHGASEGDQLHSCMKLVSPMGLGGSYKGPSKF